MQTHLCMYITFSPPLSVRSCLCLENMHGIWWIWRCAAAVQSVCTAEMELNRKACNPNKLQFVFTASLRPTAKFVQWNCNITNAAE